MESEWRSRRLGDVVTLKRGYDLPNQSRIAGPIPIVSSSGVSGTHNEAKVRGPGVVTGRYGTIGQVHYIEGEFWPLNTTLYVQDFKGNHPRFVKYLLDTVDFHQFSDKAAVPGINRNHLHEATVALPSLAEQRRISEILAMLERRIENLRKTNSTLEAIAQALFKSWFVDFDPVRAKAEGREPEGMDAATVALFPSEFEDSELGLIPKGWSVDEIGRVVSCVGGATPSTKDESFWVDGVHHWATPKDLSGLQAPMLTTTERLITDAGVERISSGVLPTGTLLLSSRAPIGYLAIATIPTAINQGFIAMPPGGLLPPSYLLFWTKMNMELIKQKANGSTFMEISKAAFRTIKVCVPSREAIAAFTQIANPLLARIELNEHRKAMLAETRDTLLPRLISGKLRLPDAEAAIEDAIA